ncbi:unnamed protein product, partial [Medioppia subpectinata]
MKNLVLNIQTFINFLILVTSSYGDIRCYCNLPQCVRTGYMCKSSGASAACYSEQSIDTNGDGITSDHISRHGCIELPQQMRDMCVKPLPQSPPSQQTHHNHHSHSHRHHNSNQSINCCFEDMCNYVKNIDLIFSTRNNNNINNDHKL